jgi:hypothetical protein
MSSKQNEMAGLLMKAASSFVGGHPLSIDLTAMAFAVENMSAERFASISIVGNDSNNAGTCGTPATDTGATQTQTNEENAMKQANTSGEFWSKEASACVLRNLVFDVVGSVKTDASSERPDPVKAAVLPAADVPNGSNQVGVVAEGAEPVAAAALPKEATPNIAKVLDSDIVAKAEATPVEGLSKAAGDVAAAAQPQVLTQEACGIKLATETMGYGVEISAAEQAQLDQLFG